MKKKNSNRINCSECRTQADCCKIGAWIDLREAKKIISRGIKGDFFHLEKDDSFPSGFKIGTSYEDEPCTFLRKDGLCKVHKISYKLKPVTCKEFPYEDKKLSPYAEVLCSLFISKIKKKAKKK